MSLWVHKFGGKKHLRFWLRIETEKQKGAPKKANERKKSVYVVAPFHASRGGIATKQILDVAFVKEIHLTLIYSDTYLYEDGYFTM